MAKYWLEYRHGQLSDLVTSTNQLDSLIYNTKITNIDFICASGEDIDYNTFLAFESSLNKFKIYNCDSKKIQLIEKIQENAFDIIQFIDCKISNLEISEQTINELSFSNCIFEEIKINQCKSIDNIQILDNTLINDLNIVSCYLINSFEIKGAILKQAFFFASDINHFKIKDLKSNHSFKIEGCHIDSIAFTNIDTENLNFLYTTIKSYINIAYCQLKSHLEFNECRFENAFVSTWICDLTLIFNDTKSDAKSEFYFNDSSNSKFEFNRCYFSDEVKFKGNSYNTKRNFFINETIFKDLVLFNENSAKSSEIFKTLFQKGVFIPLTDLNITTDPKLNLIKAFKKNQALRKSREHIHSSIWCTLKNQSLSRNDKISALEYKKYEMDSYSKELRNRKGKNQEKIVLFLNGISNNHGISWGQGLVFTICSWILFYSMFVMSIDCFEGLFSKDYKFLLSDKIYWKNALDFLWLPQGIKNLTDSIEYLYGFSAIMAIITFLLGKIFVGYGIYQTISAFRKHGQI